MTNNKNNVPIYAEEQTIQQKIKIPTNFVELQRPKKNNEEKHIAIIFFEEQIKNLTQRITELRRDLENETLAKRRTQIRCQELERIIKDLRRNEQVLTGLQNNFTERQIELGNQITT